jgi:hypothetical protein
MPFRWRCTDPVCGKMYSRHRSSIDVRRHVCSRCKSKLVFMGKFGQDGQLLVSEGSLDSALLRVGWR